MASCRVALAAAGLWAVGCSEQTRRDTPETAPAERDGVWLRSDCAEAFVSHSPHPRVLVFRKTGGRSPLLADGRRYVGIRTWFMAPRQIELSGRPAEQEGRIVLLEPADGPLHVRIEGKADAESRLQVIMDVALSPDSSVLRVRHGIRNAGDGERTIAVWAIASFPTRGLFAAPWPAGAARERSATFFFGTPPLAAGLVYGKRAVGLDLSKPTPTGCVKIGIVNPSGWGVHADGGTALRLHAPFVPGGDYPEGGANMTLFNLNVPGKDTWGEIEHVGPLTRTGPGETAWLEQTCELLGPLPTGCTTPDAVSDHVGEVMESRRAD